MLTPIDHLLFVVLAVLFPIRAATFGFRRLQRAAESELPRVRRQVYGQAIAIQWSLTAVVLAMWFVLQRPFGAPGHEVGEGLGLVPRLSGGLIGILAGVLIVGGMIARQRRAALEDDTALERLRARFRRVERMLPTTRGELRAFYLLSLTAGVCEELLYRGYVIWYLERLLGGGFLFSAALCSVLFGFGHLYQGPRGMLLTGMVGAFLAALYWVSGSLIGPMVVHALMDAHSGNVLYHALARERERVAAPGGALPDAGGPAEQESAGSPAAESSGSAPP